MDEARAKRIAAELEGREVSTWTVHEYVGYGKSAVILRGTRDMDEAALKVFDPDLVERYGRDTQLSRIKREMDLIGKHHPNLIDIKDGGECTNTGYLFVAMAYLPHKNLSQVIETLPRDMILPLIAQVASAARFLEDNGLAHRDIKPENIGVSDDFSYATLLDLGVLRPVGLSNITDEGDQKAFVATLRYSPPELLYREEEDNVEGWRVITFYQLGAVLHDMIMRYPIFREYGDPYARLADAVRHEVPRIVADDADPRLVVFTQTCLVKNPKIRLSLVTWDHFLSASFLDNRADDRRKRVMDRIAIAEGNRPEGEEEAKRNATYRRMREFESVFDAIKETARAICVGDTDCFPPFAAINAEKSMDTGGAITICFGPSEPHALGVALTLRIDVIQFGDPEAMVELAVSAVAANRCLTDMASGNLAAEVFYRGPYNKRVVEEKLNNLLLSLLDKGQGLSPEDVVGTRAGVIENAVQLAL